MTLVEVLVAIVIFGFGLLGAAGLQLATLRSNQYAATSAVAMALARDYAEAMQMFPSALASTSTGTSTFFPLDTDTFTPTATVTACNDTTPCSQADMIDAIKADWQARVKALPVGRAEICRDSTPRNADGAYEWGNCDGLGDIILIKLGWATKAGSGETDLDVDRPKIAVPVMGNLTDFVP